MGEFISGHSSLSEMVRLLLMLARNGPVVSSSVSYTLALENALCYGWIEGEKSIAG
jgi:hypothetical protein